MLVVVTSQPMPETELVASDLARVAAQSGQQREGFLASRRARHLAVALARPVGGVGGRRVSIAHAAGTGVCAAAMSPTPAEVVGVGVDAERFRPASPRTARFFLDEREQAWLMSSPPSQRVAEHLRLWTAKEAMFKSDPANGGHVLRDYRLSTPADDAGYGWREPQAHASADPAFGYINRTIAGVQLTVAIAVQRSAPADIASLRRNVSAPPVTFEAVTERISAILAVPAERLSPDSTLADLAADSFLLVEMVVDLQEEFDAIFTQAELRQVTKLSELVSLLQSHAGDGETPTAGQGDGPRS